MALREYAGAAKRTALAGDITATSTNILVADATGYPTGVTAPFLVAFDLGNAAEEKVLISSRSGNTLTVAAGGRGYDGTTAAAHAAGASVDHVLGAIDIREANVHANDPTAAGAHAASAVSFTPTGGIAATDVQAALVELDTEKAASGHTHASATKTIRVPHTFTISGEVKVAVGDDFYIPPFFVAAPAGQTARLVAARHRINSGTSATVDVQVNGTAAAGFGALSVTTTTATTDPADVALADGDAVQLVVTAVSGTPKNLSFTCWVELTV